MATRICKICGKSFETSSSRRSICYENHYHTCPVCGKEVLTKDLQHLDTCCSGECSRKLAVQSARNNNGGEWPANSSTAIEKRKQTNLHRYGVDNVMRCADIKERASQNLRTSIQARIDDINASREKTSQSRYGTAHPMQSLEVKNKVASTCLDKYGYSSTLQVPQFREAAKQTIQEKYGVDNVLQSTQVRKQIEKTNLSRYGVPNAAQAEGVKQKRKQTMIDRYGTEHPLENEQIRDKSMQTRQEHMKSSDFREAVAAKYAKTMRERYGGIGYGSPILRSKLFYTNQSKYGTKFYTQSDDWKDKFRATCKQKYGVDNPMKRPDIVSKISAAAQEAHQLPWPTYFNMKDVTKSSSLVEFLSDPREFILKLPQDHRTEPGIAAHIGLSPSAVSSYVISHQLYDIVKTSKSGMEDAVCEFLSSLGVRYIRNARNVISPLEIDIFIPDHQLGIECNPTCTHNSSFCDPWGGPPKSYTYHQKKSEACANVGIFLFHIFGYEWTSRCDVIKSMLANLVNASTGVIYARNTEAVELSDRECKQFLDQNHRQCGISAMVRLGLRTKSSNELVSVMTFGKLRGTLGKTCNEDSIELSRFCSKLNWSVVGGASKLLSYFERTYQPARIVSFSDVAHTRGGLYSKLGFEEVSRSSPSYVWVNTKDDSYLSRVKCQKRNLRKLFNDDSIDVDECTERQIMESHGYAQVFDCGVIRWEKFLSSTPLIRV